MKVFRLSMGALAVGGLLLTSCTMPGQPAANTNAAPANVNAAPANTLTLSKSSLSSNEQFSVTYSTDKLTDKAWIGVIPSATTHGSEATNDGVDLSYKYLSGSSAGTASMVAPAAPGNYDIRLNDGGKELASVSFVVVADANANIQPKITLDKTTYKAGEALSGKFMAPSTLPKSAWIGIVPSATPHGTEDGNDAADVDYIYVDGKVEGPLTMLAAPATKGSYDVRMSDSDANKELATITFTVE